MVTWCSPSLGGGPGGARARAGSARPGAGAGTPRGVHRPIPRGPDVSAPGSGEPDVPSAGPRTSRARDKRTPHTVAGQFRIRTGFPCGDSEHEHTSCGGCRARHHMLCRPRWGRTLQRESVHPGGQAGRGMERGGPGWPVFPIGIDAGSVGIDGGPARPGRTCRSHSRDRPPLLAPAVSRFATAAAAVRRPCGARVRTCERAAAPRRGRRLVVARLPGVRTRRGRRRWPAAGRRLTPGSPRPRCSRPGRSRRRRPAPSRPSGRRSARR